MADIITGLVGWWKLDETSGSTATDSSGNGNNGTLVGSPVWTGGKIGGGLQFNGSNSVTTPLSMQLGDFTISVWFKDLGSIAYARLVDKNFANGFWLGRNSSSPNSWGGGVMEPSDPYGIFGTATDGQWQHITSIRRGNTHELYINSILLSSNQVSTNLTDITTITIGSGNGQFYFKGILDDIRVYNKALTNEDVTALYNYSDIPKLTATTLSASILSNHDIELTWNAITNATGYKINVYKDGILINSITVGTVTTTTLSGYGADDITVKIIAIGDNVNYSNSEESSGVFVKRTLTRLLFTVGVSVEKGVIPPMYSKLIAFKLFEATISLDKGVIPPKNYFQEKISNIGVSVDKAESGILIYQIM